MAIDYKNTHRRNILREAKISGEDIESGHIVRFRYYGKDAHEPHPMVLVLNPDWKNKLHGLALRVLSESELLRLYKIVKTTVSKKIKKKIGLNVPVLKADITNPQSFYESRIKRYIRQVKQNPYRTYIIRNISRMSIIDYRMKDMDIKTSKRIAKK